MCFLAKSTHQNGDIPEHREKHHYSKVSIFFDEFVCTCHNIQDNTNNTKIIMHIIRMHKKITYKQ